MHGVKIQIVMQADSQSAVVEGGWSWDGDSEREVVEEDESG